MKIIVAIVNYGTEQLKYLNIIVNQYLSMSYDVDIVIHTNMIYPEMKYNSDRVTIKEFPLNTKFQVKHMKWTSAVEFENVNVMWKLDTYEKLPWTTRQTLYDNKNDYDFFIFTENDHLITEKHIDDYLKVTEILPDDRIAGHMQYEVYPKGRYYPAYHAHYKWDFNSVEKYGDYTFAHFNNVHQACYMLTRKQHDKVINVLPNYRLDLIRGVPYNVKPRVNTDIFTSCGMKKLIPISHWDDFQIYHLPNVYQNINSGRTNQGAWDRVLLNDIKKLMDK